MDKWFRDEKLLIDVGSEASPKILAVDPYVQVFFCVHGLELSLPRNKGQKNRYGPCCLAWRGYYGKRYVFSVPHCAMVNFDWPRRSRGLNFVWFEPQGDPAQTAPEGRSDSSAHAGIANGSSQLL